MNKTCFILLILAFSIPYKSLLAKPIANLSSKDIESTDKLKNKIFKELRLAKSRVHEQILQSLNSLKIKPLSFKSYVKRRNQKEFFSVVKSIFNKHKSLTLGSIKDLIRGRIELENLKEVKALFLELKKKLVVEDYILPFTKYEDYPRYHLIIKDKTSELKYELQIGTHYTTKVINGIFVTIPSSGKIKDFHSLWFKKLSRVKDKETRKKFKLDFFESDYDQLLVATGEGRPKSFRLRCEKLRKLMASIVSQITKEEPELLK